jgi:TRAP-type C4-dicarboxylate transport system substrate-binding protein
MKRTIQVSILCIAAVFFCMSANAKTVTLTFSTDATPGSLRGDAEDMFFNEVEKLSNGEIQIKKFWGSSLMGPKETLKGIENGVVDMAIVNPARYPKRLKYMIGFTNLQKGPYSYEYKIKALVDVYNSPEMANEIASFKQKTLYHYTMSYLGMAFNTPVTGFADLKGKRVRSASPGLSNCVKHAGGVPTSLPFSDVYMALQTKAIDGVMTSANSLHRIKVYEAAPYVLVYKGIWSPLAWMVNINQKKYDALSEKHKKVFAEAAATSMKNFGPVHDKEMDKIVSEIEKGSKKLTIASDAETEYYLSSPAHEENIDGWVARLKKQKINNGREVVNQWKSIVDKAIAEEKK